MPRSWESGWVVDPDEVIAVARLRAMLESGAARNIRRAARLSLREVGEVAGASPATILRWENGDRTPRAGESALRYWELLQRLMRGDAA